MCRFGQVQQIAAEFPIEISVNDLKRVEVGAGGKFHAVAEGFVMDDIFGADEVAFGKKIFPVPSVFEIAGAYTVKRYFQFFRLDFVLMCHQIVVKGSCRAEVQTAAVG